MASIFQNRSSATFDCKRNIEMIPLCKIKVTHRVVGSREVRRGGVVDAHNLRPIGSSYGKGPQQGPQRLSIR
jgi:hypothetical protein